MSKLNISNNILNEQKNHLKPTTTIVKLPSSPIEIIDLGYGNIGIKTSKSSTLSTLTNEGDNNNKDNNKDNVIEYLIPENGWIEMHGFLGNELWSPPRKISHNNNEARPGYTSRLAHEYEDIPEVLSEKVTLLAKLIKNSSNCLIYTGAGISTSSGINDYASQSGSVALNNDERPRLRSPYEAKPTIAHHGVVSMYNANLVHYWVQQNHDGLPQKAGLPQHAINEIHGAWYDPSNPVVAMSGQLRTDLFQDLLLWEDKTDLTISMGTTMCGMNSDRVFTTVASKGLKEWKQKKRQMKQNNKNHKNNNHHRNNDNDNNSLAIGGVIINLQQTQYDSISCLRIFSKLDKLMELLICELGLPQLLDLNQYNSYNLHNIIGTNEDIFQIPYDTNGVLISNNNNSNNNDNEIKQQKRKDNETFFERIKNTFLNGQKNELDNENNNENNENDLKINTNNRINGKTILDLREGSKVKLVSGPHAGDLGEVTGKNREGHYHIRFMHKIGKAGLKKPFETIMGSWWIEAALNGTVPTIPVVNYSD